MKKEIFDVQVLLESLLVCRYYLERVSIEGEI